jgi:SET domain-containing protein
MSAARSLMFKVRRSKVHGLGVFAARRIRKGTRIVEYLGERISHREANRRHAAKPVTDNHTFLYSVDRGVVIDASVDGNDARFINHGCDPNCESVTEDRRIYIDAIKSIEAGEELKYDYSISRDKDDPPNIDEIFACHCGGADCRGTMLWPAKRPKPRQRKPR